MSRAVWPNADKRRLLMNSITGGKPLRAKTSALVICQVKCTVPVFGEFDVGILHYEMPPMFFVTSK